MMPQYSFARTEYWNQRVSLFEKLPLNADDIVFLGNSITDGGEFAELFNNPKIKNRGISGDNISGVLERINQVANPGPAKIFLMIGINDLAGNVTPKQLALQYEALVEKIHKLAPDTKLYIESILPVNDTFSRYKKVAGKNPDVVKANEYLKTIAQKYGDIYIDLWSDFVDKDGRLNKKYTNDGLHLTGDGYLLWVSKVEPFIE